MKPLLICILTLFMAHHLCAGCKGPTCQTSNGVYYSDFVIKPTTHTVSCQDSFQVKLTAGGCWNFLSNVRIWLNGQQLYFNWIPGRFGATITLAEREGDYVITGLGMYEFNWKFKLVKKEPVKTPESEAPEEISTSVEEKVPDKGFRMLLSADYNSYVFINEAKNIKSITVSSLSGHTAISMEVNETHASVPVDQLPAGIYLVSISLVETQKPVLKRMVVSR